MGFFKKLGKGLKKVAKVAGKVSKMGLPALAGFTPVGSVGAFALSKLRNKGISPSKLKAAQQVSAKLDQVMPKDQLAKMQQTLRVPRAPRIRTNVRAEVQRVGGQIARKKKLTRRGKIAKAQGMTVSDQLVFKRELEEQLGRPLTSKDQKLFEDYLIEQVQ